MPDVINTGPDRSKSSKIAHHRKSAFTKWEPITVEKKCHCIIL